MQSAEFLLVLLTCCCGVHVTTALAVQNPTNTNSAAWYRNVSYSHFGLFKKCLCGLMIEV